MSARVIFQNISPSMSLFCPKPSNGFPVSFSVNSKASTPCSTDVYLLSDLITYSSLPDPLPTGTFFKASYSFPVAATVSPSDVHVAYFLISARSLLKCPLSKVFMIPST